MYKKYVSATFLLYKTFEESILLHINILKKKKKNYENASSAITLCTSQAYNIFKYTSLISV